MEQHVPALTEVESTEHSGVLLPAEITALWQNKWSGSLHWAPHAPMWWKTICNNLQQVFCRLLERDFKVWLTCVCCTVWCDAWNNPRNTQIRPICFTRLSGWFWVLSQLLGFYKLSRCNAFLPRGHGSVIRQTKCFLRLAMCTHQDTVACKSHFTTCQKSIPFQSEGRRRKY